MLVTLWIRNAPAKYGQVAFRFRCTGVSWSKDAAKAPNRVLEKFLGKYQFVSRGSSAIHDRMRVSVSQPEGYVMVGTERAARQGKQWAQERHRLTGVACFDECN